MRTVHAVSRSSFPIVVRVGSVAVKIYRQVRPAERGRAERTLFQLSWHVGGVRRIKQFADLDAARAEAKLKAEALAAGRSEAAVSLSMDDVALLSELRKVAGKTPPLAALEEWAAARALCGDNLLTAARAWAAQRRAIKPVTARQAVEAFLASKQRARVSMKSYNAYVAPLAEEMGDRPFSSIPASALEDWIHERFGDEETETAHPGTFNTVRKRLVTLWKWARKQGFLPDSATTEADKVEPMREDAHRIGILSLMDFVRVLDLMRRERPEHLAVAVLAGFAGLRRSELHAQSWEDIDLKRGLLRVTSAKRNTVAYRLVHLCPAAVEWLTACLRLGFDEERKITPISPAWGVDRVRVFAREASIPCPENGFRHSFITYRCAATGNVAETAQEAGNSAAVVFKHYRELVSKEDGNAWFDLTPARVAQLSTPAGKVIAL